MKKKYRKLVKQNNKKFRENLMRKIEILESRDPKAAWRLINDLKAKKNQNIEVDIEKLVKHLEQLGNLRSDGFNKEFENKITTAFQNIKSQQYCNITDSEITLSELTNCSKQLKNGKAVGDDKVSNEMIKCSVTLLGPTLTDFFNKILKHEKTPEAWGSGWIVPIYKSGAKNDPKNYRPITVTSCISKLFTLILNTRLINFLERNKIITEFQIGFKKNSRTSDHIFLLKTIIEYYKKKHKHIYACFVDFSSAFPSIWRLGLFYKLYHNGLSTKFINIIISLYKNTMASVKIGNRVSKKFSVNIGTKQGCNLSPSLFNLFTNDIPHTLLASKMDPISLAGKEIPLLMYADDIVILSQSSKGLQNALNALSTYCKNWKLSININKTKIVIFNSRGKIDRQFEINGTVIEKVSSYTYLGIAFTSSGKFTKAIETLTTKARKLWFKLSRSFNIWEGTPVKVLLKLFSSLIQPIMLYGCEVWGSYLHRQIDKVKFGEILYNTKLTFEKLQIQICKQILGLNKRSSNISTLGELGRFPLMLNVSKSVFNYWLRASSFPKASLINIALNAQQNVSHNFLQFPQILKKKIKYNSRSSKKVWTKAKLAVEGRKIMEKLKSVFKSMFQELVRNNNKLELYHKIKWQFQLENYLKYVTNIRERVAISKFRTSAHNLPIETGRYQNIPREERLCKLCKLNKIGCEKHILFECDHPSIQKAREQMQSTIGKLIPDFTKLQNEDKLLYVLSCSDQDLTKVIGGFLNTCLKLQKEC